MIDINNLTNYTVDKKKFSTVAKKVLSGENRLTENISLAFVGKKDIKNLNKKFRKKDKATDVLSFELKEEKHLGEIVICPEVVKENAKKYGNTFKDEMLKVFIHGILHLLGYDHEKSFGCSTGEAERQAENMERKQEKYLPSQIKSKRF